MQRTFCRKQTDAVILQCITHTFVFYNEILQEGSVHQILVHMARPAEPQYSKDGNYGVLYLYVIELYFCYFD